MKSPRHIAILGYGLEGRSARRFLKKKYPKASIEARDAKISPDYLVGLEKFDMIVRSPGVKYLFPEIQRAKKQGVQITSATRLFFNYARGMIIGITGTKGKGTTASMLYAILRRAGKDVYLVGNIGSPMLDIVPKLKKQSISIVELSSFQLQDLDVSPRIAVVLDIAPDHLNYHVSMKEYVAAKANIALHQGKGDMCFYIKGNAFTRSIAQKSKGKKIPIDVTALHNKWRTYVKIPGAHNVSNAIIAATVAHSLGVDDETIRTGLSRFRGLPYHLELIKKYKDVLYYNDSASTNPVSAIAALEAVDTPKILIAGGADKNFDYSVLKNVVRKTNTRAVIIFGANRYKISRALGGIAKEVLTNSLPEALLQAKNTARRGDSIIFSPASASFDMFKNSKERGKTFSRLVKKLR